MIVMDFLIPGYNYDIFISYRQKDNRHDGWVTEFAENLKGELEATFKEEISVYFDLNPHDGLSETHDVSESLKEKLKCLIFNPVTSRTSCDPKSLALEPELKTFVGLASGERKGLIVELEGGNVKGRVLLVHRFDPPEEIELPEEDISGAEKLTDREKYGIMAFYAENVEHNYEKAINYMDILEKMYPENPVRHNNPVWYYQQTKQFDDAIAEYKKTVSINPRLVITYGGLPWVYQEYTIKVDSSFAWAERMISGSPYNARGYFYPRSVWACTDSTANVLSCYLKAREIDPDLKLNQYSLVPAYRSPEDYAEAAAIPGQILEKNPDEAFPCYDPGISPEAMGNQKDAIRNLQHFRKIREEKWLKEYPDYFRPYTSLATVAARFDEMELSKQMPGEAMSLDSTQCFYFAEELCLQGDIPGTLKYLELALDNGNRNLYRLKNDSELSDLNFDIRFRNLPDNYFSLN